MRSTRTYSILVVIATTLIMVTLIAPGVERPPLSTFFFWIVLLAAVDLLPVSLGHDGEVTMGIPINLALAILFPPWVAMAIVGLSALDLREIRREIPLLQAIFNRAQLMLAVGAAAAVFALDGGGPFFDTATGQLEVSVPLAALAVCLAATLHVLVNLTLVAIRVHLTSDVSLSRTFSDLLPQPIIGFILSYMLLTGLGVVTALAYLRIGAWAVAAILVPVLFARLSIIGARAQQELSDKVRRQQQALLDATEKVFAERENERNRIAGDIHDSSLQMLAAAAYGSSNATEFLDSGQVVAAREAMITAREAIDSAMAGLRESLMDLRRSSVEEGGLMDTVRNYADQVATLWGAKVSLEGQINTEPPIPVALAAFQILQEGLVNALKHAQTGSVVVRINDEDGRVHIVVEDEGAGFDLNTEVGADHVGMKLMKERAAQVGGEILLDSKPGAGTRLEAILPGGVAS